MISIPSPRILHAPGCATARAAGCCCPATHHGLSGQTLRFHFAISPKCAYHAGVYASAVRHASKGQA